MKNLLTLAWLLIACYYISAQSFNYEEVVLKYRLPAKTPFTTDFKTVTVRFQGEEYLKKYGILTSDLTSDAFRFVRYKNIPERGDLHLDIHVGTPEYLGVAKEKQTKKEGETEVTYYYYKGAVITPISYVLRDGARNIIEEKIMYSAGDHLHFYSDSYRSPSALETAWEEGKNIVITQKMKDILLFSLGKTAEQIRDRFDDQVIEDKVTMFDIKKPEKIQAEFLNTAFSKIRSGLSSNPIVTDWDDSKKTEIKDLLMKGTKLSTGDKDQVVGYAIAHFNLALLNLFWGDIAAAKSHLSKGRLADRKNWEFDQVEKKINELDGRGIPDAFSSKPYVGTYQEGADNKLPGIVAVKDAGTVMEDLSGKKARTLDTVYVKNGDQIIGYVTVVHTYRKLGPDQVHDFTHLLIKPLNMAQEEIKVPLEELVYIRHKNKYLAPKVTNMALSTNPPVHLYEFVKVSKNNKLALMRTGYHESMPYELSGTENRAYLFVHLTDQAKEGGEILSVSAGSRYVLGLNGALAKDFETCSAIATKAKNKHYKLEESSLIELVDDYDKCGQ